MFQTDATSMTMSPQTNKQKRFILIWCSESQSRL